jgi:hypothetical protein
MLHFASYSVGPKDSINFIADDAIIPTKEVQLWTYIYFGYSGPDSTIRSFVDSGEYEFDKGSKALHYVAKYFALYLGKDGFFSPLNGKFAYVTVHFGPASWIPMGTPVNTLKSFVDGDTNLIVHDIQDSDDHFDKQDIDHDGED